LGWNAILRVVCAAEVGGAICFQCDLFPASS